MQPGPPAARGAPLHVTAQLTGRAATPAGRPTPLLTRNRTCGSAPSQLSRCCSSFTACQLENFGDELPCTLLCPCSCSSLVRRTLQPQSFGGMPSVFVSSQPQQRCSVLDTGFACEWSMHDSAGGTAAAGRRRRGRRPKPAGAEAADLAPPGAAAGRGRRRRKAAAGRRRRPRRRQRAV